MGGYVAAIRAAQLGLHAVVVEEDMLGGTCLHRGCIPTKALLQTGALLDSVRHADRLGVRVDGVSLDYPAAARRRDVVVAKLHRGVEYLLNKNRVDVVKGRGRLAGANRAAVSGREGSAGDMELEAGEIILATGSRPRQLPGLSPDGKHVVTSDEALNLDRVPASAIVVGAGAVGVEFASLYRSFGAEVTLLEAADRVVPLEDADVSTVLRQEFERRGIRCLVGARLDVDSLERNEGGVALSAVVEGAEVRLQAELLLNATGRSANTEDLGLEGTGVVVDRGVVTVGPDLRTGEPGVRAIGDLVGGFWLAHKAMHEGIIAAESIAGGQPEPLNPNLVTRTTYCSPQIASLGLTEAEAEAAGHDVRVGVMPLKNLGRAVIWAETSGFCKIVADRSTEDVLGVHLVGHEVTELIYGPALGSLLEATPRELSRAIAPHPTLSEVLSEAALAVNGEAIHI